MVATIRKIFIMSRDRSKEYLTKIEKYFTIFENIVKYFEVPDLHP